MATKITVVIKKHRVNNAIDDFEMQAIGSGLIREVHVRVAADGGDIYVDLGDANWHAVVDRAKPTGAIRSFTDGTSLANQSALGQEIGAEDLRA